MMPINRYLHRAGTKFISETKLTSHQHVPSAHICSSFKITDEKPNHRVYRNITNYGDQCFARLRVEEKNSISQCYTFRNSPSIGVKLLNGKNDRKMFVSNPKLSTRREYHSLLGWKARQIEGQRNYSSGPNLYPFDVNSPVVEFIRDSYIYLHDVSGLPMWAVIMMTGVAVKLSLAPFNVIQYRNTIKLQILPQFLAKAETQFKEKGAGYMQHTDWSEEKRKRKEQFWMYDYERRLKHKMNCSLLKSPIIITNNILIVMYCMRGLRALCAGFSLEPVKAQDFMHTEGLLWFSDLTTPDLILPMLASLVLYIDIEMRFSKLAADKKMMREAGNIRKSEYFLKAITLCMIPIGYLQPACIACLWLGTFSTQTAINCILRLPKVDRLVKPKVLRDIQVPNQSATPNRDMIMCVYQRYHRLFSNIVKYIKGSNAK